MYSFLSVSMGLAGAGSGYKNIPPLFPRTGCVHSVVPPQFAGVSQPPASRGAGPWPIPLRCNGRAHHRLSTAGRRSRDAAPRPFGFPGGNSAAGIPACASLLSGRDSLGRQQIPTCSLHCLIWIQGYHSRGQKSTEQKKNPGTKVPGCGGRYRTRTCDLLHVKQMLYQLS